MRWMRMGTTDGIIKDRCTVGSSSGLLSPHLGVLTLSYGCTEMPILVELYCAILRCTALCKDTSTVFGFGGVGYA